LYDAGLVHNAGLNPLAEIDMKTTRWLALLAWLPGFALAGSLSGLTPDELQTMQAQGALVVDVRTPEEWKTTGLISGSRGLTYFDATGGYDKDGWLQRLQTLKTSPGQAVILVCRSGHRSSSVGKMLSSEAGYDKVYHLEKGLRGWSMEGKPLAKP
jgi:rhodanese-related sulfurtransferase